MPAAAVLFSPWTDLAGTGDTLRTNSRRDAMFTGQGMDKAVEPYLAGADLRNPLASPLYADLAGLPPLLIHAGSYEILLDDSRRLGRAGPRRWRRMCRCRPGPWCRMCGNCSRMPESGQSMDAAAAFLKGKLRSGAERLAA